MQKPGEGLFRCSVSAYSPPYKTQGRGARRSGVQTFRPCYSSFFSEGRRMPTRDDAWKLVCEYTQSESLRKHMLTVETCVRAYARKAGADEELWGLAALLHDFDYERWPNTDHSPDQGHP